MSRFFGSSVIGAPVEREELFVRLGQSHADPAGELIGVERMQRLAEFEHDEIRDVDDVVHRAEPDRFELRAEPIRARADGHVFKPLRGIERALVRRADPNGVALARSGLGDLERPQRLSR